MKFENPRSSDLECSVEDIYKMLFLLNEENREKKTISASNYI